MRKIRGSAHQAFGNAGVQAEMAENGGEGGGQPPATAQAARQSGVIEPPGAALPGGDIGVFTYRGDSRLKLLGPCGRHRQPAERGEKGGIPRRLNVFAELLRQPACDQCLPKADSADGIGAGLIPVDEAEIEIGLMFKDRFEERIGAEWDRDGPGATQSPDRSEGRCRPMANRLSPASSSKRRSAPARADPLPLRPGFSWDIHVKVVVSGEWRVARADTAATTHHSPLATRHYSSARRFRRLPFPASCTSARSAAPHRRACA